MHNTIKEGLMNLKPTGGDKNRVTGTTMKKYTPSRTVQISFPTRLYRFGALFAETKLMGSWPESNCILVSGPAVMYVYHISEVFIRELDGSKVIL